MNVIENTSCCSTTRVQKSVPPVGAARTSGAADPAGTGLMPLDDGRMWIERRFAGALKAAGLDSFAAVMQTRNGHCMRALQDRENWRLQLDGRTVYLKKHHVRTVASRLRAKLHLAAGDTAALDEARNLRLLARESINCMELVAFGQRLGSDGLLESFLISEELCGYVQLDHFIAANLPQRELHHTLRRDSNTTGSLKALIDEVAHVARRFHQAGYNHRDLYCCHFFIRAAADRFEVRLIDLQRVQHRRRFRRRWIVKDLAQLAYSAPRERIKCTHKMAFMRSYLGVDKLRPCDKRLIRAVLAKQQLMERKQGIIP